MTEYIGRWGISSCGFFRHTINHCDRCNNVKPLYRVFHGGFSGYRDYSIGLYCLTCARALATKKHLKDKQWSVDTIAKEWDDHES